MAVAPGAPTLFGDECARRGSRGRGDCGRRSRRTERGADAGPLLPRGDRVRRRTAPECEGPRVNGLLSRDGMAPSELLAVARAQLRPYDTVEVRLGAPRGEVRDAWKADGGFGVLAGDGRRVACRKLLLATGMVDELPPIPGIGDLWGRSVFPCPYCDAYEFRGQRLGVLGAGEAAATLARLLTTWSDDVTVFTGLPPSLEQPQQDWLDRKGVCFLSEPVTGFVADGDRLKQVLRAGAPPVPCDALFLSGGQHQRSPLVAEAWLRDWPARDRGDRQVRVHQCPGPVRGRRRFRRRPAGGGGRRRGGRGRHRDQPLTVARGLRQGLNLAESPGRVPRSVSARSA